MFVDCRGDLGLATHLINELENLNKHLLQLGAMAEQSVRRAGEALNSMNVKLAQDVIKIDHEIDKKEVELEEDCLKILALHQPVANDLRRVVSVLRITNDLERIGDLGVNIAERVIFLAQRPSVGIPFDFESMWTRALEMVRLSLDSFVLKDVEIAKKVCEMDDEIDSINRSVYDKVYAGIRSHSEHVEALIHYLSISRHLERVADYATNISEDVIYMIDGKIVRHLPDGMTPNKDVRDIRKKT